jgi:anthranilate phosphoribosyltransferase
VVAGDDGLDEVSATAATRVVEVNGEEIISYTIVPAELGFAAGGEPPAGGTPEENAALTQAILAGGGGDARPLALINAGVAIYAAGGAPSLRAGVEQAREAVDDGRAARTLERFIAATREAS